MRCILRAKRSFGSRQAITTGALLALLALSVAVSSGCSGGAWQQRSNGVIDLEPL